MVELTNRNVQKNNKNYSVNIESISGNAEVNFITKGLTEKRATEIFDERLQQLLLSYIVGAHEIAVARNRAFMGLLIAELDHKGLLGCFAEPSIQIALSDAQKMPLLLKNSTITKC